MVVLVVPSKDREEAVRSLLAARADKNKVDTCGDTPLQSHSFQVAAFFRVVPLDTLPQNDQTRRHACHAVLFEVNFPLKVVP